MEGSIWSRTSDGGVFGLAANRKESRAKGRQHKTPFLGTSLDEDLQY